MKTTLFGGLLVLAALLVSNHAAAFNGTPMKGKGHGEITGLAPVSGGVEITATGSGEATHLGKYTRTEQIFLDPSTGALTGSITFVAADGSELFCEFSGGFTGPNTASGTYDLVGGTGRFQNASGTASFNISQTDPVNFDFSFIGTIDLF